MAERGRSRKNGGQQHGKDVPARRRTGAGASHDVDSRHDLQQLRQFRNTFIDDVERAISGGKDFGWDRRSRAIWEDQMWELNSMNMEGSTSAIQEVLLNLRNRFLQSYIVNLEDELDNVELGSKDEKKANSVLSRLKEEYEMTGKCEDAKEFFAWYFSRKAQEKPDNDSLRGRGKNIGRDIRNSQNETPSRSRDSSRDPYFGNQTRSVSPSTSIRSQSTIGGSRAGSISGRGLESTPLSGYDRQKYMVDTCIEILKTQIQTARNWKWTCKTHSAETGIIRERYLWQYWETIKSDLQEIRYDDDLFDETVAEAWTEYLESYKIQLLKERRSYEALPGVQVHLQRYDTRIKHLEDELSVIRKSGIYKALNQFQSSEDTSAYEPRTGNRDSHQDTRHVSGVAKGHTRNTQPRSHTPDRYRSKIDAKTKHTASLEPKRLKDECIKYTNDCNKIAEDSLVCWERSVMKTGNEQIRKLNEIDPDSESFYKELGPVMSKFINWFIENANKELKSIEQRAKKNRNILETHRDVKKSMNDLIKQGTQLLSKLQSLSR